MNETTTGGRRGAGTTNHCMHGDHVLIEEVLDWRPFDYLTLNTLLPMPGAPKVLMTYAFTETTDNGTRIEIRITKPKPKDLAFLEQVGSRFHTTITAEVEQLRQLIKGEDGAPPAIEEPALPASRERVAAAPVTPP